MKWFLIHYESMSLLLNKNDVLTLTLINPETMISYLHFKINRSSENHLWHSYYTFPHLSLHISSHLNYTLSLESLCTNPCVNFWTKLPGGSSNMNIMFDFENALNKPKFVYFQVRNFWFRFYLLWSWKPILSWTGIVHIEDSHQDCWLVLFSLHFQTFLCLVWMWFCL